MSRCSAARRMCFNANSGLVQMQQDKIVSVRDVSAQLGLSKATIYRLINDGAFPRPISLSRGRVGWKLEVIQEWIDRRPTTSKKTAA